MSDISCYRWLIYPWSGWFCSYKKTGYASSFYTVFQTASFCGYHQLTMSQYNSQGKLGPSVQILDTVPAMPGSNSHPTATGVTSCERLRCVPSGFSLSLQVYNCRSLLQWTPSCTYGRIFGNLRFCCHGYWVKLSGCVIFKLCRCVVS